MGPIGLSFGPKLAPKFYLADWHLSGKRVNQELSCDRGLGLPMTSRTLLRFESVLDNCWEETQREDNQL